MQVKLISITPNAEQTMAYCARVSSPHQDSPEYAKLLSYCVKNKHWSVFEMANMTVEITTSRAIAQQILRHRSFTFQEHSQRYAEANQCEIYPARRQDNKNRQNSIDDMPEETKRWFERTQKDLWDISSIAYEKALKMGIAKEQARFLLPLSTQTRLYMNGNIRNWLHYVDLRADAATQKEHRDIAIAIKHLMLDNLPIVCQSMGWSKE